MRMSILFLLMIAGCQQVPTPVQIDVTETIVPQRLVLTPEPDPQASPTIRLVVDPLPVASGNTDKPCPMDASVLIDVVAGPSHFSGSGTCIQSDNGESRIITNAHTWRGVVNPQIRVTHQKKDYVARVVHENKWNDIAVLAIDANLPAIDISDNPPAVGDTITNIGARSGGGLEEWTAKVVADDRNQTPRAWQSDGRLQVSGRSGGGAFLDGKLCGTIVGHRDDSRKSLFNAHKSILRHIAQCEHGTPVPKSKRLKAYIYTAEKLHGDKWCKRCNEDKAKFGNGNSDVELEWVKDPAEGPEIYPAYRFYNGDGDLVWPEVATGQQKILVYKIPDSLDELLGFMQRNGTEPEYADPVSSSGRQPVGASIEGAEVVEAALSTLEKWFGPDAEFAVRIVRNDGLDAIPMGRTPTREELLGKSGRIEIRTTSNKVPIHEVAFDYRFAKNSKGKNGVFFKFGEIEYELPDDNDAVSGPQPVGMGGFLLAWTIISTIQTVYAILTPSVDVWLGKEINATAKLSNHQLAIDCGPNPPAVRAHWRFWLGLLRFEHSRPLTNITVAVPESVLGFHKSRVYRDVPILVK